MALAELENVLGQIENVLGHIKKNVLIRIFAETAFLHGNLLARGNNGQLVPEQIAKVAKCPRAARAGYCQSAKVLTLCNLQKILSKLTLSLSFLSGWLTCD